MQVILLQVYNGARLDNVKIIFTNYFGQNDLLPDGGFFLELAALSNYYAQKHGYQTHFFGDEQSIELVKKIKYNQISKLPETELNKIPKCLWSLSKFVSISMMNEPFLHLDMDLILKKNVKPEILKSDIICCHTEEYVSHKLKNLNEAFKETCLFDNFDASKFMSFNCSILGGQNFEYIKSKTNFLLEHVYKNKEYFDYTDKLYKYYITRDLHIHFYFPPVLIEQVWLFQLFLNDNKKIARAIGDPKNWVELLELSKKHEIAHFMGLYKMIYKQDIIDYTKSLNIDY